MSALNNIESGVAAKVAKTTESFKIRSSHYIIGGLSLVAALGWNEAIKKYIAKIYSPTDSAHAALLYAIIITLFLIVIVSVLPDTVTLLPKETQEKIQTMEKMTAVQTRLGI
jgi:hypothetical protein